MGPSGDVPGGSFGVLWAPLGPLLVSVGVTDCALAGVFRVTVGLLGHPIDHSLLVGERPHKLDIIS